jgi:hypothetical protein
MKEPSKYYFNLYIIIKLLLKFKFTFESFLKYESETYGARYFTLLLYLSLLFEYSTSWWAFIINRVYENLPGVTGNPLGTYPRLTWWEGEVSIRDSTAPDVHLRSACNFIRSSASCDVQRANWMIAVPSQARDFGFYNIEPIFKITFLRKRSRTSWWLLHGCKFLECGV